MVNRKIEGTEHHDGKILKDRVCTVCGGTFDVTLGKGCKIPIQFFFSRNLGKSLGTDNDEYWECETCSGYTLDRMKEWMIKNWGERCLDYCEECSLCQAWKCFDYLFKWTEEGENGEHIEEDEDDERVEKDENGEKGNRVEG